MHTSSFLCRYNEHSENLHGEGGSCLAVFIYLLPELIETPIVVEHSKEFNFRKIAWEALVLIIIILLLGRKA